MRSHSRAIHSSKAIPSKIIRNRGMDSNRAIHPKVEDIQIIRSKVMHNSKVMPNSKAILNKDMRNNNTISNRVMDNHLPGKTCRPGNCP